MPKIEKGFTVNLHDSVKRLQHLGVGTLRAVPGTPLRITAAQHEQWKGTVAFKKLTAKRPKGQAPVLTVVADGAKPEAEAEE